ncbi:S41 family peptidase [Brumimicrobium mesophilum]|uniref:S41 family peptidase n=1 Tax=Brumimicrobium mesophilum TaxID=392717 RepID=UPI000D143DD3|nr:S41 family peptidase [Brumimicrobium mesophilum]
MKTVISIVISFIFISNLTLSQKMTYISTSKAIEDIEFLIKNIEEIHYNPYFMTSKEYFNRNKKDLINKFAPDSIPYRQFIPVAMKLVALMSGGHTSMSWKNESIIPELKNFIYIPFTGKLTDNLESFIVTKSATSEIKIGEKIESINGISIVDLYNECMSYIGGIPTYKNANTEIIFPLLLFYNQKISAPYAIDFVDSERKYISPGLAISELLELINEGSIIENYTFEILGNDIGLITYNKCQDYKAFEKFTKSTFKALKEKNINKLIIDIRQNGGGNSDLNDLLLSYITEKQYRQSSGRYWKVSEQSKKAYKENNYEKFLGEEFMSAYYALENQSILNDFSDEMVHPEKPKNYFSGKTCFLIGPSTFSSANFLADAVKTYKLSTLVGTSTGEYTNDFGEQLTFILPHSGSSIYVSSTYDIGANGNPDIFEPVSPNIEVKENVLEYAVKWFGK